MLHVRQGSQSPAQRLHLKKRGQGRASEIMARGCRVWDQPLSTEELVTKEVFSCKPQREMNTQGERKVGKTVSAYTDLASQD